MLMGGVADFCASVNSMRTKEYFLLGVHLANEKDEGSYKNLKELLSQRKTCLGLIK